MAEDKDLYALALPGDALEEETPQSRRNVSTAGRVSEAGTASVVDVSLEPGERLLRGRYRGRLAYLMAAEVEELFSGDISFVPYRTRGAITRTSDGYYALENVEVSPVDQRTVAGEGGIARYDGVLRRAGSRKTHDRRVTLNPQTVTTPYGSASGETVRLPAEATAVRWFDPAGPVAEAATGTLKSETGERTTFVEYDLTDASFYDPTDTTPVVPDLVYRIDYSDEHPGDVRVFDTVDPGRPKVLRQAETGATIGNATIGNAAIGLGDLGQNGNVLVANQWQRVYNSGHEFGGEAVLETGDLRLRCLESRGQFDAYRATGRDDEYAAVSLGNTTDEWALWDLDLRRIGQASLEAVLTFENQTTGATYPARVTLDRGQSHVLVTETQGSIDAGTTMPADLQNYLAPIARATDRDVTARADIVARAEVPD
jgi:hypothetical protein